MSYQATDPEKTDAEKIDLMIAHAQAALDMDAALVEKLRRLKLDSALDALVCIRHRHEQVAGLIGQLMHLTTHETPEGTCSSPTTPD